MRGLAVKRLKIDTLFGEGERRREFLYVGGFPVRYAYALPYPGRAQGLPGEQYIDQFLFIPYLSRLLKEFYELRGWDPDSGMPLPKKLSELGLDWVAEDLYK